MANDPIRITEEPADPSNSAPACLHLVLRRILMVGLVRYQCTAATCGKIFEVPAAETIVIRHG
jgi:hypothetical protein